MSQANAGTIKTEHKRRALSHDLHIDNDDDDDDDGD